MIKVILGPMKCGKSLLLLREAEKLHYANKKYILIRPKKDTRKFISRSFKPSKELNIQFYDGIEVFEQYDYLLFDEFQLFDESIIKIILKYNKQIIIAGLLGGSNDLQNAHRIELLNNIKEILPFANEIIKLNSICDDCGSQEGNFSYSLNKEITISDDYKVLCLDCLKKYDYESKFLISNKKLATKIVDELY